MKLKVMYEKQEDIPDGFQELYTEKDGKFELTGIDGIKTQEDVNRVQSTLEKERKERRTEVRDLTQKLKAWEDLGDRDEIVTKLDSIPELQAKATGKLDETKIQELVNARVGREKGPLERELAQAKKDLVERDTTIANLTTEKTQRIIHDAVRSVALESKVHTTALDDILDLATRVMVVDENGKVYTKDNVGVTPNVDPKVWLSEMAERRPHWWPPSGGGGATGGGGGNGGFPDNPWAKKNFNVTKQAQIIAADPKRAEQMARAAGVPLINLPA